MVLVLQLVRNIYTRCWVLLVQVHAYIRTFSTPAAVESAKTSSQLDEDEVAKFDKLSSEWWTDDRHPLYLMNSVRIPLLKSLVSAVNKPAPRILDVGCGGGYLAEELAKQGFGVTAIDPSENMIRVATRHAQQYSGELDLEYQCTTIEEVTKEFDIVVSSEVAEHVPCVTSFVNECAKRVRPGGGLMITTINRTLKSWVYLIILGEYVTGLLPRGTHEYHKFVPPDTLTGAIADCGFDILRVTGHSFNHLTRQWSTTSDLSVNYAVTAIKRDCEEDVID